MQAFSRSKSSALAVALAAQHAGRAIATGTASLRSADETHSGRGRGPKPDAYAPWAREVYGRRDLKTGPLQQQARRQQPQRPSGGERERQPPRPRQHAEGGMQARTWVPRPRAPEVEGEGLRINYADTTATMVDDSYVRVAPRMEQRQARMHAAYIYNLSPALLRADVAAFFDGYGLPEDEIRPEFTWKVFGVERFWLNFGSAVARERAMTRHTAHLGTRRVLMQRATPQEFTRGIYNPLAMSSRGRYILAENLSPTSTSEDLIRFFQGFDLHAKSVTFLREEDRGSAGTSRQHSRGSGPSRSEKAVVRFTSPLEAHRALRERQGGFCGSSQLRLRVLQ
ncbi:hypothetical protein ACK3TF_001700 [Chlorella vulgaris]